MAVRNLDARCTCVRTACGSGWGQPLVLRLRVIERCQRATGSAPGSARHRPTCNRGGSFLTMTTNRVPVFRLYQPTWSEPAYYVLRDVAIRMVRDRAATCINRGKAIRLTFHRPENLRDESARIGPATIHAYACGSLRAFAAVEGWRLSGDQAIGSSGEVYTS